MSETMPARLRGWAAAREKKIGYRELRFGGHTGTELLREAADEIERLHTALRKAEEGPCFCGTPKAARCPRHIL